MLNHRVWKDLTLSSDADRAKYKVWDYPIKEKYSHMLETIKKNNMVNTREEGYQRVLDTLDGTFAFIDESARVRSYPCSKDNCMWKILSIKAETATNGIVQF